MQVEEQEGTGKTGENPTGKLGWSQPVFDRKKAVLTGILHGYFAPRKK